MEKNRNMWLAIIMIGLVAIVGTSVAFASLSTQLNITGTGEVNPANWSIKFQNLSSPTIVGGATVVTAPTLSDTTVGTFHVKLTAPGDSVTYTFDVTNNGDLDAEIGTFTKAAIPTCTGTGTSATADEALVCNNLVYTLTYTTGGTAVGVGDTLTHGQTKNLTLKIEYPSTVASLPANTVTISNLAITIIYNQD